MLLILPGLEGSNKRVTISLIHSRYMIINLDFCFFLVKILIINVFITRLDGKLLIRNFHYKIESSSGKKYRGLI